MVMVKISETYDLSTKVGKMGFVGIHTPTGGLIDKLWSGLVLQCKKFRFVKCDVAMACASMLPADPLQIGVEAGAIAPQDMFNPILYRAVSNDSMNSFLSLLQNCAETSGVLKSVNKGSVIDVNDAEFEYKTEFEGMPGFGIYDQFQMYYGLLASEGWRKAMPQAGLTMSGLYPLVYQVINQYGLNGPISTNVTQIPVVPVDATSGKPVSFDGDTIQNIGTANLRGPAMRMPSINTMYFEETDISNDVVPNKRAYVHSNTGEVPPAYVGLIVLPPAKLNQLYYRLKVTWTVEFTGLRPLTEIGSWGSIHSVGGDAYGSDYAEQSASMTNKTSMVDTSGSDIVKIMESA